MRPGIIRIILFCLGIVLLHGTVLAQKSYEARCEATRATCTVSFDKEERISVSNTYPPADAKEGEPYALMAVSYRCDYEKQGDSKVVVCRGFLGISPDKKVTFTDKEFLDPDIRCSRLFSSCGEGWKNVKRSQ
jgi:hypothetical protein